VFAILFDERFNDFSDNVIGFLDENVRDIE
jgi:hypothetical protein